VTVADLAISDELVFGWGTFSARLEHFGMTPPIVFMTTDQIQLRDRGCRRTGFPRGIVPVR
jgi:hypothetical protein